MSTYEQRAIFVTGIVGRAMGSGQFTDMDIQKLVDAAMQAFHNSFGVPEDPAVTRPQATPSVISDLMPRNPGAAVGGFTPPGLPAVILPEGKDWKIWKGDKCYYGSKDWEGLNGKTFPDTTWEELLVSGQAGEEKALNAIFKMANSVPSNPKYAENDKRKISRAKALQLMLTKA